MIGRDREARRIEAFLGAPERGTRALLFRGEAGIGKTTLWQATLDGARERGWRVIVARPTAGEARLAHAGLNDLLTPIADAARPDLPPPQAAALDVALMRATTDGPPLQPLAIALAVLELLRVVARRGPLVIGVDDAPWMDESSTAALRFAFRRLEPESVLVVATQRTEREDEPLPPLLADLPPERLTRVHLEPLPPDDVERLLDERLGLRLTPTLARLAHRRSGGNPFLALEIGRALEAGSDAAAGDLDVPTALAAVPRERLASLSPAGRAVVTHTAAVGQPRSDVLERALGVDIVREGLADARAAAVLAADDPVRFAHPLLAAAAWDDVPEDDRRAAHRALAGAVDDVHERARHRALAADGPDAEAAGALDDAARDAHGRGAPDAAADLALLAATVSEPESADRARRLAAAGRYRLVAGDLVRARALLEEVLERPEARQGSGRAEVLLALANVRMLADDFAAAAQLAEEALAQAGDAPALAVAIRLLLAGTSFITGRAWEAGARHAAEALDTAESLGDARLVAEAIGHAATWRYVTGGGVDSAFAARVAELESQTRHLRTLDLPAYALANILSAEGETAQAHALYRQLLDRAEHDGDASSLPFLLANVAFADVLAGDPAAARARLERAERLAEVTGQTTARVHTLVARARIEARIGPPDAAISAGREALDLMEAVGWRSAEWLMRTDLALLELSRDDAAASLAWIVGATAPALDAPSDDESGRRFWGTAAAVEALVALGRFDEADATLDRLDERLRRSASPRVSGDLLRARARLRAATGDVDAATDAITEAESIHRRMEDGWELARTLLAAGEVHRRARRRAAARSALREALALFTGLGAGRWARQAQDRLGRIGTGTEPGVLTPTQRRVADLAVAGLTNRQVADRLFMSPHTVEAHLSAAYRALGIARRSELPAALERLAAGDPPAG